MISPDAEAGESTAAQCRALGLLASRSHWRPADLAGALGVAPASAGAPVPRPRPAARLGRPVPQVPSIWARAQVQQP